MRAVYVCVDMNSYSYFSICTQGTTGTLNYKKNLQVPSPKRKKNKITKTGLIFKLRMRGRSFGVCSAAPSVQTTTIKLREVRLYCIYKRLLKLGVSFIWL